MKSAAGPALALLLLEDSRFDAEIVSEALLRAYPASRVIVASDETDFLAAGRAGPVDLVLSDFEIPGYSGAEALAAARVLAPLAPFIFVSGVIGEDVAVEMMKRGATDFVSKNRLGRLPVALERALREVADREARERAERQLREVDRIYGRVVDTLKDYAVILLDQDGLIRDWNRGADIVFGITREDALGTSVARLFTSEDRAAGIVEAEFDLAMRNGTHAEDRWLLRADCTTLRADGVLTALRDDDGTLTGFCKIVRDATVAFESSVALHEAKEEAERANRIKDRFLAVLSHELRTPLTPIAAAARLLEEKAEVPHELAGLLPMIRRNVALEARLIEDLLDLTAISAGKVTLKPAPVDMRAVVTGVADMLADAVAEAGLHFAIHWRTQRSWVEGDAARLHQVLWNIVRNAVKFTPGGGCVEIVADDDGSWFRLRCIDDGIGVERAAQARIFSAFEQAGGDVSQRQGGLGLGLAIAHGLVAEHHGELAVESPGVGLGATFT
ncbi:MAG TPA: ATP-binding protein, partial [Burkholderiaceae bacterium]|nr:ATP-binding protein [Burkholderiaceae bacterium]